MASTVVDIADMKIASGDGSELVTYALGSCIGVAIYDPVSKVGGMLHYMLPEASINPDKARDNPYMFGDTGIPLLFRAAYQAGAVRSRLLIRLAGGANVMDTSNFFNIGKRNYLAARKLFFKNNLLVTSELVGGVSGKTMRMRLNDGNIEIKLPGGEIRAL
ncbi:TPA: chemotaxis protein CheD [Candidatus Sumerlaeota bacterium]|jgi:chemotaxis protein CheD|nr:chemotaxis protein CheD [Candidatus Sumerlaeota bacterium]